MGTNNETSRKAETRTNTRTNTRVEGVVIGVLTGFQDKHPMVVFPGNTSGVAVVAKSVLSISDDNAGSEVALMFEGGNIQDPIIMGLIHKPELEAPSEFELLTQQPHVIEADNSEPSLLNGDKTYAEVDGKRVLIEAEEEMVLKCGRSSITLTKAGKVIIRGAYVSTKSAGVNRIKGGSVQIN